VAATSIVVVPCAYVIAARIHLPLQGVRRRVAFTTL
jgi:hypothetical protein